MVEQLFRAFDSYDLWLAVIGAAILAAAVLPSMLGPYPVSLPIVLLLIGYAVAALPLGLEAPDPKRHGRIIEHLTEFGVIISLMGAGLKIDRPFSLRGIGSLYYLAFALNQRPFSHPEELWALVALVVAISIVIHGIFAAPALKYVGRRRKQESSA